MPPHTTSTTSPPSHLPLAHQINAAAHTSHKTLNRAILSLLPLALPPNTHNAYLYAHGMTHILPIYSAFEASFARILELPTDMRVCVSAAAAVRGLHMPALVRTRRLQGDIARLLHPETSSQGKGKPYGASFPPRLAAFVARITARTTAQPHLLLAYAHTFYLALFNGGRYIKARLEAGGIGEENLTFWGFEGQGGGEDLKEEFKRRFGEVEAQLSEAEREEVVAEAAFIMDAMIAIVAEIADVVGAGAQTGEKAATARSSGAGGRLAVADRFEGQDSSVQALLLKHLLPMGLAELIVAGGGLLGVSCWRGKAGIEEGEDSVDG